MEAVAKLRNCPMSDRKMRMVADMIRTMEVDKALDVLKFTKREGAVWLEKLLLSAIDNWKQHSGEEPDDYELYIKTLLVDGGPQLKRFRPAPFGRAHRIRKRTNHVTLVVENRVMLDADMETEETEQIEEND